jgi:hypothetical protein
MNLFLNIKIHAVRATARLKVYGLFDINLQYISFIVLNWTFLYTNEIYWILRTRTNGANISSSNIIP